MRRRRAKKRGQQELFPKNPKGAGRPKMKFGASEPHRERPKLAMTDPVHVTIRAVREVGTLRRRNVYRAVRRALVTTFARDSFRVVHLSIQRDHIHLLVEADDRLALARGMQGFQISAAKHINRSMTRRRRGTVFPDRYHATIIDSRKQARHALAYVLNNWRKHRDPLARAYRIDPYSTAASFDGWRDLADAARYFPSTYDPLPAFAPRTWYLRDGWRRYGRIATRERPGARAPA